MHEGTSFLTSLRAISRELPKAYESAPPWLFITGLSRPNNILFSDDSDYIKLIELVRKYPKVQEIEITSEDHLKSLIEYDKESYLPILVRRNDTIQFITVDFEYQFIEGDALAFIGELK